MSAFIKQEKHVGVAEENSEVVVLEESFNPHTYTMYRIIARGRHVSLFKQSRKTEEGFSSLRLGHPRYCGHPARDTQAGRQTVEKVPVLPTHFLQHLCDQGASAELFD